MLLVPRPTPARLATALGRAAQEEPTYRGRGAADAAALPAGYRHLDQSTPLPAGSFAAAADRLLAWDLPRAAGLAVAVTADRAAPGETVVLATPGSVGVLIPCRVVAEIDEPDRRGFVYGTLPGHPLAGEERFTVERAPGGATVLRLRSFSRPAGVARLGAPLARRAQDATNRRYAAAAPRLAP